VNVEINISCEKINALELIQLTNVNKCKFIVKRYRFYYYY